MLTNLLGQDSNVPEVSLEDAKEDLEKIAEQIKGQGELLLLTEMLSRIAAKDAISRHANDDCGSFHVHYDVRINLQDAEVDNLLADRNHLSREGNQKLGEILVEPITTLLNLNINPSAVDKEQAPPTPSQTQTKDQSIRTNQTQGTDRPQDETPLTDKTTTFVANPDMIIETPSTNEFVKLNPTMADAMTFVRNYVACDTVANYILFESGHGRRYE